MPEKSEFPSFLPVRMVTELIWNRTRFFFDTFRARMSHELLNFPIV